VTELRGQALRRTNWLIEAVVIGVLVLVTMSTISGWRSADTANDFPVALLSLPPQSPDLANLTAEVLQQMQPQRSILSMKVTYVSQDRASTGPYVVSVHPIDASSWAAVALGPDGHCYGMLESEGPGGFETFYAEFPKGTACSGSEATASSVNLAEVP